ncbi:MAG: 4-(cytidine 5'-diphospho)-2-C-methyl-D-erythritol kinase [Cytophagales bacterium]|nr:4-(cytidine 5'-diphospho)-2-C-methyl-D-erythritol kinase [Cytophagales bacterium]
MISFPNAKINIGLFITEKRADGFHNLESCFFPVPWKDILEIIPNDTLKFTSSGIDIPGNSDNNLCLKAFHLLAKDFKIENVHIHLHKNIPIGAGLGGGSADASFTLKMLNELFALNLSNEQLENYAKQLGSDCAFFIKNEATFAYEKGDVFKPLNLSLEGKYIVLVNPNIHISTQEAYSGVKPNSASIDLLSYLGKNDISTWKDTVHNNFEDSIFPNHSIIKNIKEELYKQGALYASMSGSGSTLFGIFEKEIDLNPFQDYMTLQEKL